jgi:hypothetical protein
MDLLLNEEGMRRMIRERVQSREWYLIPQVSDAAGHVMQEIEAKFYPPGTEANADFEIILGMPHVFCLAMAHKSRMPYAEMMKIVDPERTSIRFVDRQAPEDNNDIIIAMDPGSSGAYETAAAFMLFTWAGVPA